MCICVYIVYRINEIKYDYIKKFPVSLLANTLDSIFSRTYCILTEHMVWHVTCDIGI